jgi:hypothetical protein
MAGINTYSSILTLNVSGLNSPIKRPLSANWIKKEDPTNYPPYRKKYTLPQGERVEDLPT